MLVSEPQSGTLWAHQCLPPAPHTPCLHLFVPKGTPTRNASPRLPLGACVSGCVAVHFLSLGVSFQESVALGGIFGFVQALLGVITGCCEALVTEESCGLPILALTFPPVWGSSATSDLLEPLLQSRGLSATPWPFWKEGRTGKPAPSTSGSLDHRPLLSPHPAVWP